MRDYNISDLLFEEEENTSSYGGATKEVSCVVTQVYLYRGSRLTNGGFQIGWKPSVFATCIKLCFSWTLCDM